MPIRGRQTATLPVIRLTWQAGDANSAVALMADVQSDEQRGNLLENARVFQLAAINGTHAGNLRSKHTHGLSRIRIIAANDHIAFYGAIAIQKVSGNILESCDYSDFGQNLSSFLRCGALPDSQRASRAPA